MLVVGVSVGIFWMVLIPEKGVEKIVVEMQRGINIGDALEAPVDKTWNVTMKHYFFDEIVERGFDTVRIPIRFSDYTDDSSKYILDETFMKEIDSYIDYALEKGLVVIIDLHHFQELMEYPVQNKDKFLKIWEQLSLRYMEYPKELIFEVLNEPHWNLTPELWNVYLNEAITLIRTTNETRKIVVGPGEYHNIKFLDILQIPEGDPNLIVTIHYYEPNEVAFQGNIYHPGFEQYENVTWEGTDEQVADLQEAFQRASDYGTTHNVDIFLGEFGVTKEAPIETRLEWTRSVREEAERLGMSWSYWELGSGFGIYDVPLGQWDTLLLKALIP